MSLTVSSDNLYTDNLYTEVFPELIRVLQPYPRDAAQESFSRYYILYIRNFTNGIFIHDCELSIKYKSVPWFCNSFDANI